MAFSRKGFWAYGMRRRGCRCMRMPPRCVRGNRCQTRIQMPLQTRCIDHFALGCKRLQPDSAVCRQAAHAPRSRREPPRPAPRHPSVHGSVGQAAGLPGPHDRESELPPGSVHIPQGTLAPNASCLAKTQRYAETRDRTGDLQIFGLTLSQLSYRGSLSLILVGSYILHVIG